MRFALTLTDRYLGVLEGLLAHGWQLVKLYSTPVDGHWHRNKASIEAAQRLGVPIQLSRISSEDLDRLGQEGCEVLVVASYGWRIPDWQASLSHAINFHPSPLPEGRGPYPVVNALLDSRKSWGVSCHKIEHEFDKGDVLAKIDFPLNPDETHESLDLKVQMNMKHLAADVAVNFQTYWTQARVQETGSYYKFWTLAERTLNFSETVASIMRVIRAFGRIECLANVNNLTIFVKSAVGWEENHEYPPGTMVHSSALNLVVAAKDGYIGITEWNFTAPDAILGSAKR